MPYVWNVKKRVIVGYTTKRDNFTSPHPVFLHGTVEGVPVGTTYSRANATPITLAEALKWSEQFANREDVDVFFFLP